MELVRFNAAKQALIAAVSVDEVKEIRDKAEALRAYAKQAGESFEMQNRCAEIKVRAERKAGELLREHGKGVHGGDRKSSFIVSLDDLGVSRNESHRWQRLAAIPDEQFEEHIAEKRDSEEITTAGLLRLCSSLKGAKPPKPVTYESLLQKIRSVVEWAAERCDQEHLDDLAEYIKTLSSEVHAIAEPVSDSE